MFKNILLVIKMMIFDLMGNKYIKYYQDRKFRKLVKYAYNHSLYYRTLFNKAGIDESNIDLTDIKDFPSIDKNQLMDNYSKILTTDNFTQDDLRSFNNSSKERLFRNKYHVVHSSGSTGVPKFFVYNTKEWSYAVAGAIRSIIYKMSLFELIKLFSSGLRALYIAVTDGRYGGVMLSNDVVRVVGGKVLNLNVSKPFKEWLNDFDTFKPNIIVGYPSALEILAKNIYEGGNNFKKPLVVISCGEYLSKELRNLLEESFKTRVVNLYACSESLSLGTEINKNDGTYIFNDLNIIEKIDNQMYLTNLYNYTQPLIRYKISDDITFINPEAFSPNRININRGRAEDMMWFINDDGNTDLLHPLLLEDICVTGLLDYQFVYKDKTTVEVFTVCFGEEKNKAFKLFENEVKSIFHKHNFSKINISFKLVDYIKPDEKTGKKRLVLVKN